MEMSVKRMRPTAKIYARTGMRFSLKNIVAEEIEWRMEGREERKR
jgi:hypothetical protein